jgi:hypothetical protein
VQPSQEAAAVHSPQVACKTEAVCACYERLLELNAFGNKQEQAQQAIITYIFGNRKFLLCKRFALKTIHFLHLPVHVGPFAPNLSLNPDLPTASRLAWPLGSAWNQ